jgi:hypothetical protein
MRNEVLFLADLLLDTCREGSMKLRLSAMAVLVTLFLAAGPCFSLTAGGQRNIEMLVKGGPESQKDAAQSIFNGSERDPEVLDVVAEVLLQIYQRPGFIEVDATAWLCKALGSSGNGRYRMVLQEVADKAAERKVKKYASQALDMLPQGNTPPYRPGTVNIAKLRNTEVRAQEKPVVTSKSQKTHSAGGDDASFDRITNGMSMQEVYDLIGQPTASTSRITGKAWAPFYYGGDTTRMFALYKGKGRIVFSNSSRYSSVWRVIEIVRDPAESGYP